MSGVFVLPAFLLLAAFVLASSPAAAQSEGQLRIVPLDADVPSTGRLEIFHTPTGGTGRWGPICDDAFRMDEAKVACKQMGYRGAEDYILRYSMTHAHTEAAYWLDDMDCNGSESTFTDCRQQNTEGGGYFSELQWGQHDCNRLEQAGVQCTADTALNYTRVDKRALTVVEGLSATFRVWLGKAPSGTVTVTMTVNSGPDLTLKDSGDNTISTLTFTTSNWSDPQTVTVEAASDTDTTDDTGITIGFSATGGGYAAATVQQDVRVTIRDDDVKGFAIAPTSLNSFETEELNRRQIGGVAAGDYSVSSTVGDPPVTSYTVRMKGPPSADVTVALAVTANTPGGTGAADVSFEPSTLTFTTSDWSTPQTVTPIVTEDDDTVAETVTISHTVTSTDGGYNGMSLANVTMEVKDTRLREPSGLSVSNAEANESDTSPRLNFKVTLSPSSEHTVTVKYKTIDRTALAPDDYIHKSGTLTFAPGETEKTVSVTINDDSVEDDGETLWLRLTDPTRALLDDSWGLGTIHNTETGGDNTAPTGLPTISGTARVGETLTASETGIADADGLANATFAWQWIANDGTNDTDIADATDATYTLTAAEQGKTIKVRATFTDDGGTEETLTSAATEAVAAAAQQQVASDTEAPTVTVTSDATGPVTGDFDVTVTFSEPVTGFEMSELAIVNGTASAMTGNEAGDVYTVTVTPAPGASGTLTVEVPAGVASDAAENANTASGTFGIAVRTALTASFPSVAREHDGSSVFTVQLDFSEDVKGLSYRTLKFGGIRVTGGTVAKAKRRPPGSGQGKYWTIHVEPDGDGDVTVVLPETTDCAATGAVCTRDGRKLSNASRATVPGPASTPLVSIAAAASPVTEGTAASFTLSRRGGPTTALTVDVSVSEDGAMVDGTAPSAATFAANSTTATLTVATADDEVAEPASVVTATISSGTGYAPDSDAESASVTVEDNDAAPANATPTGLPEISGTATVGETLTASETGIADADGLTDATFAWQWIANDGTEDTDIADATDATYTLTAAEEGKTVKVRVTFTDDGGTEETLVSAATAEVAAAVPQVSVAASSSPVTEGTAAAFTLSRTGGTTAALTVAVNASEAGTVLSGTPASTATFAAGNASATLSLATENDAVDEADARVTVTVSAGTGYTVDPDSASAGVDVYDNDAAATGEATVTTLWSTTLQWADWNGNVIANAADFTSATWSEDGSDFRVWYFAYDPWDGTLWLRMNSSQSGGDIPRAGELTLHIGDETVEAGDALSDFAAGRIGTVSGVDGDWEEGDRVSVRLTRTVAAETTVSLPGLSVTDAQVREADGAALPFVVTLGDAQTSAVSVRYATSDGTATAGLDYEAVSGMLRFEPGQTSKTVSVPVINDEHDDDGETLSLSLSQPFGATLADGTATGTIVNTDPMPQAWIARFGRTVAEQVLEAVESRMQAPRTAGVEVSLGERQVGGVAEEDGAQTVAGRNPAEPYGKGADPEQRLGLEAQTMRQRDFLLGSSFSLTGGTERDGTYALWGRGAVTRFDGRDGALSLDGEVTSAMLGADWSQDALMAGLVISHSRGEGSYSSEGGNGGVISSLTGLYPWGRYALSERVSVWGVAGYGEGALTLTPEGEAPISTDLDLRMAAAGLRGVLVQAPETGGLELAVKSDALGVQTSTAKADGLAAADAEVTRLRLGIEGSLPSRFEGGASLVPSVEIGVRRDGGDAETGSGIDIGGGIAWSDPQRGLSAEFRGRGLLSHEADGFRERGFSGSLSWDPTPETARGLSLTMSQTVGVQAAGGMDALLEGDTLAGLAANDDGENEFARRRFEMSLGYGFGVFGDRFTATPGVGLGLSDGHREYRLGWWLGLVRGGSLSMDFDLSGLRREAANDEGAAPEHVLTLQGQVRW